MTRSCSGLGILIYISKTELKNLCHPLQYQNTHILFPIALFLNFTQSTVTFHHLSVVVGTNPKLGFYGSHSNKQVDKSVKKNIAMIIIISFERIISFQTNELILKKEKLLVRLNEAEVLQNNLDRRSKIVAAFLR